MGLVIEDDYAALGWVDTVSPGLGILMRDIQHLLEVWWGCTHKCYIVCKDYYSRIVVEQVAA